MYDHPDRMKGKRRFTMVWTMGNDPIVRKWSSDVPINASAASFAVELTGAGEEPPAINVIVSAKLVASAAGL